MEEELKIYDNYGRELITVMDYGQYLYQVTCVVSITISVIEMEMEIFGDEIETVESTCLDYIMNKNNSEMPIVYEVPKKLLDGGVFLHKYEGDVIPCIEVDFLIFTIIAVIEDVIKYIKSNYNQNCEDLSEVIFEQIMSEEYLDIREHHVPVELIKMVDFDRMLDGDVKN